MSENGNIQTILRHYQNELVKGEITRFAAGRWIAIHCQILDRNGRPYLLRHFRRAKRKIPLKIDCPEDVIALIERFSRLKPRTFYASINVYKRLGSAEDVRDLDNITYCLPTWDIDNKIENWTATIEVAKEILKFLRLHGIEHSVFLKWSGNGMHIHIHHKAFSDNLLKKLHPLNIAYSIVEYVNIKLHEKYLEIASKYQAKKLRVENKIDLQRVFTCPLSLHRQLDVVAVCIDPQTLDDFSLSWVSPESFRHWKGWDRYVEGEADSLAIKAYKTIGGYPLTKSLRLPAKKRMKLDELILKWMNREAT
ncbi:hypothetical protein DRO54_06725 [Candidatus Bathyarchaeota archaeon]|nr:MAG: hypothetical protein DRO54_06725 [Candidatus Bathyarchaeota archaeon]